MLNAFELHGSRHPFGDARLGQRGKETHARRRGEALGCQVELAYVSPVDFVDSSVSLRLTHDGLGEVDVVNPAVDAIPAPIDDNGLVVQKGRWHHFHSERICREAHKHFEPFVCGQRVMTQDMPVEVVHQLCVVRRGGDDAPMLVAC